LLINKQFSVQDDKDQSHHPSPDVKKLTYLT